MPCTYADFACNVLYITRIKHVEVCINTCINTYFFIHTLCCAPLLLHHPRICLKIAGIHTINTHFACHVCIHDMCVYILCAVRLSFYTTRSFGWEYLVYMQCIQTLGAMYVYMICIYTYFGLCASFADVNLHTSASICLCAHAHTHTHTHTLGWMR